MLLTLPFPFQSSQIRGAIEKNRQDWLKFSVQELQSQPDKPAIWRMPACVMGPQLDVGKSPQLAAAAEPGTAPQPPSTVARVKALAPAHPVTASLPRAVAVSFHPFFRALSRCTGLLFTRIGADPPVAAVPQSYANGVLFYAVQTWIRSSTR